MTPIAFLGQYLEAEALSALTGETYTYEDPAQPGVFYDHHGLIVPTPPVWPDELNCEALLPTGKPLEFFCVNEESKRLTFEDTSISTPEMGVALVFHQGIEGPPLTDADMDSVEMVFMVKEDKAGQSAR